MLDTKKYYEIYEEIKELTASDTLQLIQEAENEEVKHFYVMVGNYLLQKKQKKVIEKKLF